MLLLYFSNYYIFCKADLLRDILYEAYLLGMTEGEYVFLTLEILPSDWLGYYEHFLRGNTSCIFSSPEPKAHRVSLLYSSRASIRPSVRASVLPHFQT